MPNCYLEEEEEEEEEEKDVSLRFPKELLG